MGMNKLYVPSESSAAALNGKVVRGCIFKSGQKAAREQYTEGFES